jgi:glyoxylase-like metal-dependent hydrolase (beta-lactamase superfamily II)
VIRLDELATVVLAPNPSPMTLEGTNTYLLGAPDTGEVIVVDPGPDLIAHRRRLDDLIAERDAAVAAVVLTHHHADHAEAAAWAQDWGAPLHAYTPALVPGTAEPLRDGDVLRRAGLSLEVVHTPGHASDHVCLRIVETDAVLTGDHVLGRGSTVVLWPDGDMADYMASLRRVAELGATSLYPGHGPAIEDPETVVLEYLAHREERERQVLGALRAGDRSPADIVSRVYVDVDPVLHPAAERSVRAHLAKLVADGVVAAAGTEEDPFTRVEETP